MQKRKLLAGSFLTALFLFPAFCPAQTISIVSGNGQLVCPDCTGSLQKYTQLVAQVNDATGKPVVNTTVTWIATQSGYPPVTSTSTTNSSGQASYTFVPLAFRSEERCDRQARSESPRYLDSDAIRLPAGDEYIHHKLVRPGQLYVRAPGILLRFQLSSGYGGGVGPYYQRPIRRNDSHTYQFRGRSGLCYPGSAWVGSSADRHIGPNGRHAHQAERVRIPGSPSGNSDKSSTLGNRQPRPPGWTTLGSRPAECKLCYPTRPATGHRPYGFHRYCDLHPCIWQPARFGGICDRRRRQLRELRGDSVYGQLRTAGYHEDHRG